MSTAVLVAGPSKRRQRQVVLAALLLYTVAFTFWWPNALVVSDESTYVGQAELFAEGRTSALMWDDASRDFKVKPESSYPAATSLVQAAFILVGGWRAAAIASLLSACVMVWLLMIWLERTGSAPILALLALLYPPTAVLGRVAMSDVPSGMVVTAGWLLFWVGVERRPAWVAAGFVAGASILWRDSNCLLFAPLFLGAFLRRERGVWRLLIGVMLGVGLRLLISRLVFGTAFFARYSSDFWIFSIGHPLSRLAIYLFALTVMVPGGLPAVVLYRGRRRPEVIVTVAIFFAFYLAYFYDGSWSMLPIQLILGPRFFIPLLPILVFALGEVVSRVGPPTWWSGRGVRMGVGLVAALELVAVHPILFAWGRRQIQIRDALYAETSPDAYVIINADGVGKMTSYAYGRRRWAPRTGVSAARVAQWASSPPGAYLAFVDRSDTPARVEDARENAAFEHRVAQQCALRSVHDEKVSSFERLRILKVESCALGGPGPGG